MEDNLQIVMDYVLENNDSFIDKMMVQVIEAKENYILQEIGKVSLNIGVYVDEKRLKEWFKMCSALENIPEETIKDIAIHCEIERLKRKVKQQNSEIHFLQEKIRELEEVLENDNNL